MGVIAAKFWVVVAPRNGSEEGGGVRANADATP